MTAGLNRLIIRFDGKENRLIAIVMLAFCIGGMSYGMAEESIPFVAIIVPVAIKLGFDPIVGVSMILIALYSGYSPGPLNPFNTGIAQDICQLPTFSGIELRLILAAGAFVIADEIGELPLYLQPKLLKAIQDKKIQRVGSNKDIKVNLRILSATNRNLEKMMEAGEFREDLFYRLNVIPIYIPPLRKRRDDIQPLLLHFLSYYGQTLSKDIHSFSREALSFLQDYDWPGNVRELQNAVEYAVNMAKQNIIEIGDLPRRLRQEPGSAVDIRTMDKIEEFYIREALRQFGDNLEGKEKAAQALGMSRSTLYRKIKERQIE